MTDLPDALRALSPALAARAATMAAGVAGEPIVGERDDAEWREMAARSERTPAGQKAVAAGLRAHPFGPDAVTVREKDEPVRILASEDARKTWANARGTKTPAPVQTPPTTAPAVPAPTA